MRKALTMLAAIASLAACGTSAEEEAAAKACTLFEDSVNGFLVLAEDGANFEPATVRSAITDAAVNLQDSVDAAPADLAADMRDAKELVGLYAKSLAIGRDTADVGGLMFAKFKDVKAACAEAGAEINYPPSFND